MNKLMRLWSKWRYRTKSMVRYRLLFLTSAPIFLTLIALFGITAYWSIHYTWQSALIDVSERLSIVGDKIDSLQDEQFDHIQAFSESYEFRTRLNHIQTNNEFDVWVSSQRERYQLDFLRWMPANKISQSEYRKMAQRRSFFDVLSRADAFEMEPSLAEHSEVWQQENHVLEERSLVSRSIIAVFDDNSHLLGYLDGGVLMNNNLALVDRIRDTIYPVSNLERHIQGTVTLFLDDLRIATNVPMDESYTGRRALGTLLSEEVSNAVLVKGESWIDKAYVYDTWYIAGYKPIRDIDNNIVGIAYTGYLVWPLIKTYITNIGEVSVIIIGLLLVSGFIVYRGARDLFRPIEQIHRVVKMVQLGKDEERIGELGLDDKHELSQLAKQFDNMLNQLQFRNEQIQEAAHELEGKVHSRTASLKEKTEQLELHIKLLNQTRNKLVTNEKLAALGELTAGIAHEINNPTAVILGNVELMRFELGSDVSRVEEEIDVILAQIDRIRNITRSLLQYSRQGGVQDEVTWQHVNPIVDESVTLVRTGAKKRDVEFIVDLNAKTPVEVNRHQLLQILVNLQMNAIHAMQGKGRLTVLTEDWVEAGQSIGSLIHVIDEGCGISDANIKRIFDPFFTTKRDGTGLGLSVSQSILSQTGGEIRVKSKLGEGSQFTLYLPQKADHHLLVSA
ncbi:sensor histidine kinase [Vibrio mediterranei]|uniref:histidine kinase n=1 Tax=Vibrio mediterranei TaxID=689 RepID=A0A3G4VDV8_9VIBR|nr:HAMP domain-containing sensor histidine kinase [Vibrio mediterranei]AYV22960.1 HAMP domain-containing protein [Vibrio mediterranei]